MGHIFISYSRHDLETVDRIVKSMKSAGIDAWLDREDIQVGNSWRVQIVEAIDTCDAFVLMLSSNSAGSQNVHKEVILAQDSARPTYVVMLEVVRLPAEIRYQLAGLQFINLPLLGLEKSTGQLISALKPHLKKITPDGEGSHKQAELVIQGIDLSAFTADKQEQLLAFISTLANTSPSQLKIANMTAGSVHVFVDMPATTAFQLKALALNSDPRFKELGIVFFKLAGDRQYINISSGSLTAVTTTNFWKAHWMKFLLALILILAIGFFYPKQTPAPLGTLSPTPSLIVETNTASPSPEPASTSTEIPLPTSTHAPASIATETSTSTSEPVTQLTGIVDADQLSCRYGPGASYLYAVGLIKGNKVVVLGQADTTAGTWIYISLDADGPSCWVNAKFVKVDGDLSTLEQVYPEKAPLILFSNPKFPPPSDVNASREGDQVEISWSGYELGLGDRESADSPRYLVELWTCQNQRIVFTAYGAFDEGALVTDEAGCSEPSHGQVFLAHKDGYVGPVSIPWPPQ